VEARPFWPLTRSRPATCCQATYRHWTIAPLMTDLAGLGWEGDLDAMREGREFGQSP
jgi:hypothetical protein